MALSAAFDRKARATPGVLSGQLALKAKLNTQFYQGGLVVVDGTTGLAEPATAAASKFVAGIAEETVKSAASGDTFIKVRRSCFKFANKGGDAVTDALILRDCYVEDDSTVRATATNSSRAGKVIEVASDGVWVETY